MKRIDSAQFPTESRAVVARVDNGIQKTINHTTRLDTFIRSNIDKSEVLDGLYDDPTYNADIIQGHEPAKSVRNIAKYTTKLVREENNRTAYLASRSPLEKALFTPVPDMEYYRNIKDNYRRLPIDTMHELTHEPVVSLKEYGVSSRAYYSRPNNATIDPVEGVSPDVYVRQSVAETLRELNEHLKDPRITEFFGGEVELFVDEGFRDPKLQEYLYTTVIPNLVRNEFREQGLDRDRSEEEFEQLVSEARDKKSARPPSTENDTPSPHGTGAAVDLSLRFKDPERSATPIPMGRGSVEMTKRTDPDHFEHVAPVTTDEFIAQQNRRAFYAIMTGRAFDTKTDLLPNPTEFWHWSRGDQLSAIVSGLVAYYGFAKGDSLYGDK